MSETTSTDAEREAYRTMTRRNAAKWLVGLSGAAAVVGVFVNGLTGLPRAVNQGSQTTYVNGTHLVDENGNRIAVDALPAGQGKELTVFPEKSGGGALTTQNATTLLLRFSASSYGRPTHLDWTPQGYVAYSKVCTHEGCLVSDRSGTDLLCPCHNSVFDPLDGARVVSGPAPRALPQLPIGVTSGDSNQLVVATGGFDGPIGPQS